MNNLDFAIIIFVSLSAFLGLWRGFLAELVQLVPWVFGILGVIYLAPLLEAHFLTRIHSEFWKILSGDLLAFLPIYIVLSILSVIVRTAMSGLGGISASNRLLGFIFGLIRGVLLVLLALSIMQSFDLGQASWWKQSRLAPYALPAIYEPKMMGDRQGHSLLKRQLDRLQ